MEKQKIILTGILIGVLSFLVHLSVLSDYPVSWDYHFHYYGGLYHLGLPVPSFSDPSPVPFTAPDPRLTVADPFGPFLSIVPTLSQIIFHEKLNLLPFDSAYNLPSVLLGSMGVGLMYIFLAESVGISSGLIGALFLFLFPYYFGHTHINMKDIPNAFVFALSVYFFWKFERKLKITILVAAVLTFAFAFNYKINSAVIPVICFLWLIWTGPGILRKINRKFILVSLYFIAAPVAALSIWWMFWSTPLLKLFEILKLFSVNTIGMPVLYFGGIYQSCFNIPLSYPYGSLLSITPFIILISFITGALVVLQGFLKREKFPSLLVFWFFVPLLRYLHPQVCAIDGVRHFMEVIYPYIAIAAIGFIYIIKKTGEKFGKRNSAVILTVIAVISLSYNIIRTHPYQMNFYGIFAGTSDSDLFDGDMWGTSQKEAAEWLNRNAPKGSFVNIAMAQSTAALYLRDDLLLNLNKKDLEESDYTVVLNRKSFFEKLNLSQFVEEKIAGGKVLYKKTISGRVMFWIFLN